MTDVMLPEYGKSLQGSAARIKMLTKRKQWVTAARANQLPPTGENWDIWLVLAGRGFGKTRLGASAIAWDSWDQPETISHVIASTHGDLRSVCYEGESGLLNQIPHECIKTNGYNRSLGEIYLTNGSIIRGFSAEAPDRARGPQCHRIWGDEVAAWDVNKGKAQEMFDMSMMGLRLGHHSYAILTTTPKPIMLIKNLVDLSRGKITANNKKLKDLRVKATRGSTDENFDNLSRNFQILVSQYKGTRLGRQELEAEILEDIEGALWSQGTIDENRCEPEDLPEMVRIVVSIDPAASSHEKSDETGLIAAGVDEDGEGYILEDRSGVYPPDEWAKFAIEMYHNHGADCIIGEVNNGGEMVEAVLRGINPNIPFKAMRASRGKVARAEPVAALYEQHKIHHVGSFPKLEEQLTMLTIDFNRKKAGYSPDRADALVWAATELMLGDMDSLGLYEYYRKQAAGVELKNSSTGQSSPEKDWIEMEGGPNCSSTIFGMNGEKINVVGGKVRVPQELESMLLRSGFIRIAA